jgi:hypothetical protein
MLNKACLISLALVALFAALVRRREIISANDHFTRFLWNQSLSNSTTSGLEDLPIKSSFIENKDKDMSRSSRQTTIENNMTKYATGQRFVTLTTKELNSGPMNIQDAEPSSSIRY